jgi:4-diphosphocytidyl-2-C-methyl-D-erythritol kinase
VYQTVALYDIVRVDVLPGTGTEVCCEDPRVPRDERNTCYRAAQRVLATIEAKDRLSLAGSARIVIKIEKHLPVQGGLGAASSNAVATMLALERALGIDLTPAEKLRIAAEVGSDLPLFLIGGTVLGVGRGEEVYPLPDLPVVHVVVVTPAIGVSTPEAFSRWDEFVAREAALTPSGTAGTMNEFSGRVFTWLSKSFSQALGPASGVPAQGGNRAETPLLDLVRAGIENDFERVVFPEYPDLREAKEQLLRAGAQYASLSGSGSTLYGMFASEPEAQRATERIMAAGHTAVATRTLTRVDYWRALAGTTAA